MKDYRNVNGEVKKIFKRNPVLTAKNVFEWLNNSVLGVTG